MGSKSGLAHALGCPEWVPPGAGSLEGVLGMLWWFPCPSGPMHAIDADSDTDGILMHTCTYIQIPIYTCQYLCIHAHIRIYLHIHAHTCTYPTVPTPPSHKKSQKCWRGASLMHPPGKKKYLISAHASGSCTMLVGGLLGKVLACPEHPGRFYGRGKIGPNTDS